MKLRVYQYEKCESCRKALKFLKNKEVTLEVLSLYEQAPTVKELKQGLVAVGGDIKKLFNTSGVVYREKQMAKKLPSLSEAEALALLASEGKLVKRPFVLFPGGAWVGFRRDEWEKKLS